MQIGGKSVTVLITEVDQLFYLLNEMVNAIFLVQELRPLSLQMRHWIQNYFV